MNLLRTIRKSLQGDASAQRRLYEEHRIQWYMTSLRYGKNKMQADDIMQEGLIKIFNNLDQYKRHKGAFSTWSNRVLVNAALSFLKRTSWNDTLTQLEEAHIIENGEESIYDHLSAQELTKLIQTLPVGYRLIFNLYAIEGYTHPEIAKLLDISAGTSKSQLSKARKALRIKLESQLIASGNG